MPYLLETHIKKFKKLVTCFGVLKPLPSIKRVTCKDLSKGTTFEEDYSKIGIVPRDKVVSVAKRILSAKSIDVLG
ncbi:MAG: hypothetical protein P0Y55_17780 [Candidatus Cohnella colombiensis]|uniref:Uncharacterized protein n=1 Tax=Candidatus Cohnella colombiensis TaxID=3121368 RepID=A0AA95EVR6_9BACL|nr:MAG: hypothetical protein P0Y55_17780 [Cohnella sp.]